MVYHNLITSLSDLKESVKCYMRSIPQFMLCTTVEYEILGFQMVADNDGHVIGHVL